MCDFCITKNGNFFLRLTVCERYKNKTRTAFELGKTVRIYSTFTRLVGWLCALHLCRTVLHVF